MIAFIWELQGNTLNTEISATDTLVFSGATGLNGRIVVGEYNDSIFVRDSLGDDKSDGNDPINNKFFSQTGGSGGKSQVSIDGNIPQDLDTVLDGEASLKINVSNDSSFSLEDLILFAYDGASVANPPDGVEMKVAEVGDTNFVDANGSGSALTLDDKGPDTSIDIYAVVSITPTERGSKPFKIRIEGIAV